MKLKSIDEFYNEITDFSGAEQISLLPDGIQKEIGHFNVFNIKELYETFKDKPVMPYDRRAYYKISLIKGKNRAEYADKVINIEKHALLFATPKIHIIMFLRIYNNNLDIFVFLQQSFLQQIKAELI